MIVRVNGVERELPDGATVADLLALLDLPGEGYAVAVDREVVPRGDHETRSLREGTEVEVIRAVGGG